MFNHGKRLLSLLLVLMLFVSVAPTFALADTNPTITLESSATEALKPGETFTVTAKISGNTGYNSVAFCIKFDKTALTLNSFTTKKYALGYGAVATNLDKDYGAFITAALSEQETSDDDLFLMSFTVNESAKAKNYEISIDTTQNGHLFTVQEEVGSTTFYDIAATYVPATVTVKEPEPETVAVTGVTLDQENVVLTLGSTETATLTAAVAPENATNKNVAWTSSNSDVASVENGVVTAKSAGEATITVTTEDGSFTDTCAVKVNAAPVVISADHADLNVSAESVHSGDEVDVLISVENDENADSQYNSYEFHVAYDSAKLTYAGFECDDDDHCAVVEKEDGKLIVNGYGEAKTVSESAFVTLKFTAASVETATETKVELNKAYRDTSAMAVNRDIDEIEVETASRTVAINPTDKKYTVSFNENVKINGETTNSATVKAGETLTFEVIEKEGYDYAVEGATLVSGNQYQVAPTADADVTITYTLKKYAVRSDSTEFDASNAATAEHGKDYTFKVNEQSGYTYTVKASVNGGEAFIVTSSNGAYTIPGEKVTGEIVITIDKSAVTPTPVTYSVTYYQNGQKSSAAVAKKGEAYTAAAADGYTVYKITINGTDFALTKGASVTIPADNVTGDIEVYTGKIYAVNLPEDGSVTGEADANYGSDYRFTVKEGYELGDVTVGSTKVEPTQNGDGSYTIPGGKITGEIAIAATASVYAQSVKVYDYVKANDETTIQLVVAIAKEGALADGEILQYDGHNMFYSPKYKGYAYLVAVKANEALLTDATAAEKIGKATATATTVDYSGNVNMTENGTVDVNDAQLVYDIYKAYYGDFTSVSMEKMLRADMNANSADETTYGITVSDVAAVVSIVRK